MVGRAALPRRADAGDRQAAGFAVHQGPKGGESLEDYFDALRFGLPRAPALAHRLDRDTSGLPGARPPPQGAGRARRAVQDGSASARPTGRWSRAAADDEGRIDLPLGGSTRPRLVDEARPEGQPSSTTWKVMGRAATGVITWLALEPLTGRTHQLRVHCAAMGWPIVGDSVYGTAPRTGGPGLHLHAREIGAALQEPRADPRDRAGAAACASGCARADGSGARRRCLHGRKTRRQAAGISERRLSRSGGAVVRSAPSLPSVISRGSCRVGSVLRSTGSHSFERTIALAHW